MPGLVRQGSDSHAGHASPTPNPFHKTSYGSGSSDVFTNTKSNIRVGDSTTCGDPATSGSSTVFVNGIAVHRKGDSTGGHGSWVPNSAASGSTNVFADEGFVRGSIESFSVAGGALSVPVEDGVSLGPSVDGGELSGAASPAGVEGTESEENSVADVGDCNRRDLGKISEKYESNGKPGAIGQDRTGGFSYGSYQIATKTGTFDNYMSFLNKRYPEYHTELVNAGGASGATSGTDEFKSKFKELANQEDFAFSQHDFIQATHHDPAVRKIKASTGIDICDGTHCNGLQDAVWSTSVQHGPGGARKIFDRALARTGKSATEVTDRELIIAIYDERADNNGTKYFGRSTPGVRKSVVNRFNQEKQDALNIC